MLTFLETKAVNSKVSYLILWEIACFFKHKNIIQNIHFIIFSSSPSSIIDSQKYNFISSDASLKTKNLLLNNIYVFSTPFPSSLVYAEYSLSGITNVFSAPFSLSILLPVQF
eukprot:GHVN01036101.1.p1 GENE.GHVN01036101.1~~GHVN01036101.1.p1  ORF type:complete len:112 (-),score=1.80 GHVN01036101.1:46-381(-)